MCSGGLDPKYALGDLERAFKVARQSVEHEKENREPANNLKGWIAALFARFHRKEVTDV